MSKNIGYMKFGLDMSLRKRLSFYSTYSMLKLLSENFDVYILSPMMKEDEMLFKYRRLIEMPKWIDNIRYIYNKCPDKIDVSDIDILFIECGPCNTMFAKDGNSLVELTFKMLDKFEGKVFYWHHSIPLIFPFGEYFREPNSNVSELNLRKLFKKYDVFGGKEWTILHQAQNEDPYLKITWRGIKLSDVLDKLDIKTKYTPYCHWKDDEFLRQDLKKYDIVWVGGRYTSSSSYGMSKKTDRKWIYDKFIRYYNHKIYGKGWGDKICECKYGTAHIRYSEAHCGLWADSEIIQKTGFWTLRPHEILRGTMVAGFKDFYNIEKYLPNYLIFETKEELDDILNYIKDLPLDERYEIRKSIYEKLPCWEDINIFEVIK